MCDALVHFKVLIKKKTVLIISQYFLNVRIACQLLRPIVLYTFRCIKPR